MSSLTSPPSSRPGPFGGSAYSPESSRPLPARLAALRAAIPLDAAMPCHRALARLAEYHAWFHEDHAVMRDVVGLRMTALGLSDTAPVWEELRAAYAGGRRAPEATVIRRAEGTTVYWYARPTYYVVERVLAAVDGGYPATSVRDALGLHEYESQPVAELSRFASGEAWGEVILRDGALVGVARELLMAGPPEDEPADDGVVRGGMESGVLPAPAGAAPEPPQAAPAPSPGIAPTVVPAPPPPREVTAYPDVLAPEAVVAGVAFDVEIGLADQPVAGVSGGPFTLPAAPDQRTFDLEVRVSADGFDAPDGWTARYTTPVRDVTRGRATIALVARAPSGAAGVGSILVHYFVDGVLRGSAARGVTVLREPGVALPDVDPRGLPA
ncbi:TCAD7 domain-containing protein, partial [Roseisolibacter sp. H3M3-2]|uniref:TCAD7 domain-containing protein n=1 Tax=Roseisolibacter sp. H3M3-2 TaxID=3031323 RepID=UPI0023DA6F05